MGYYRLLNIVIGIQMILEIVIFGKLSLTKLYSISNIFSGVRNYLLQ